MTKGHQREIEEQAIIAFQNAENKGYISKSSSRKEIKDNAYEILEFMPDYDPEELDNNEFEFAVEILLSQI